jgi:signal transduction histidine kinase/ActR/RegA family two-component response regulator
MLLLAEEGLANGIETLVTCLDKQPPWSDLPIVVLSAGGPRRGGAKRWRLFERLGNVTILDRPLHVGALQGAVRAALRGRNRQYQTRGHLEDLEAARAGLEQRVADRTKELDSTRESLAFALDAAGMGSWDLDLTANTSKRSAQNDLIFGYSEPLPVWGRELFLEHVHEQDRGSVLAAFEQAIESGSLDLECRIRRKDRAVRWIIAKGQVTYAPDGRPLRMAGIVMDTTEHRDTEDALRQAQKMEAIGQLTGGVAHDFNNLLTIIRSSVDFLRRPDLPEERRSRYLTAVSETVDRAAKLTGQLLAFARRQALKPETLDVGARLRVVGDLLDTVTGARIKVVTDVPEHPCFVRVDASQFETALVNVAVNARDAMDGAGTLTLRLDCGVPLPPIRGHAAAPGPFAAVSLHDTGSGIAPAVLAQVFEPFFTTKEVGKGTGLGLSQVFGFAKQSGGDVSVETEPSRGTTFTLYLPEVEPEAGAAEDDGEGGSVEPGGFGQQVLVVEDNMEVGRFATQILEDLGYRTYWAVNAEDALKKLGFDGAGFDAVFSDVVMPGMGGVELARLLKRRLPNLPVVLASGYSHVLAQEGSHGFELLQKPYSAEQISRVLRKVIGQMPQRIAPVS